MVKKYTQQQKERNFALYRFANQLSKLRMKKDYHLKDGTPCYISELKKGGVMLVNDVPIQPGEHVLSDGQIIIVGAGGLIIGIIGKQK